MKLANELSYVIERMTKKLNRPNVLIYMENVKASGDYKNYETRIANDILRACVPTNTICDWYDKYDANDKHITTLAIRACKELGYL